MSEQSTPYRVLARKYRPKNFDEVIGQEALIRTLKNAIDTGRIAQAYMLTGIRGTGKTTTARLIARALNYAGPDGKAGPTTGPTDDCAICRSIAEDRHPDVMEMDAASRTGVDDIREILDGVRYAPTSARYKIYIIDEVHMLSKGAFNALLKTLEEPPAHVKFIFATTEIRKVPVTVLSRCQRFDLRRVEIEVLERYYADICGRESVAADPAAIAMIARAADGSVRDGLSLLDQAIALGSGTAIHADQVQGMLGLADRGRVLDLLDHALKGDVAEALDEMHTLYRHGADPFVVMNDLLDLTHMITRLRVAPKTRDIPGGLSPEAMDRAVECAQRMSMPSLGRAWQILLKGLGEINTAPNPQAAAEMVLIRLMYAANLPDPANLIKRLKDHTGGPSAGAPSGGDARPARTPEPVGLRAIAGGNAAQAVAAPSYADPEPARDAAVALNTLPDIIAFLERSREMVWAHQLRQFARPVRVQQGLIDIQIDGDANPALSQEIRRLLDTLTGERWSVIISPSGGGATVAEEENTAMRAQLDAARANPVVAEILSLFPGTKMTVQPAE